ncbi:MAG: hypothetical protein FWD69_11130 [Polyangiaceae bacterium]|nr:hypothetical protein [Polyangiaceae bacterium]
MDLRKSALVLVLFASTACEEKREPPAAVDAAAAAASVVETPPAIASGPVATPSPAATPSPDASTPAMPVRPVPKPQTMVSAGMPVEVQQKAIAYMVAMRAPHPDDAKADPTYAGDLASKLKPIVVSLDTGANKARFNRVEVIAAGRQIDLLMSGGCNDKTPTHAVVQRAGTPLATLLANGVLVVRCNDERIQCLQSTRDPTDVLCTTAPRHM